HRAAAPLYPVSYPPSRLKSTFETGLCTTCMAPHGLRPKAGTPSLMPGGGIVHKQENHHASQWNGGTCLVAADAADAPEHVWQGRYGWRRRFVDRRIFRRGQEQIFR